MNEIQRLAETIKQKYPSVETSIDAPLHDDGIWHLDIITPTNRWNIQWGTTWGFGFSDCSPGVDVGYGEGCDEHFKTFEEIEKRLDEVLCQK